jgi:hypothetical protein
MGVFGLVMIDFKKALYPTLMFIFVRRASGFWLLGACFKSPVAPAPTIPACALAQPVLAPCLFTMLSSRKPQFCSLASSILRPDFNTMVAPLIMLVLRQSKRENFVYVRWTGRNMWWRPRMSIGVMPLSLRRVLNLPCLLSNHLYFCIYLNPFAYRPADQHDPALYLGS